MFIATTVLRVRAAWHLAEDAQTTTGMVLAKDPYNHAAVRVTYEVGGVEQQVADSFIGPPNPDYRDVKVGDSVVVFYDPRDPNVAVLSEPARRTYNEIGFLIVISILLLGGFLGVMFVSFAVSKFTHALFP